MIRSALIYIAAILILSALFPDLDTVWRVTIAVAIAVTVSIGLRVWQNIAVKEWTRRMSDGSTATVGEHVFTRQHGYWSDGERALDDDELIVYAAEQGATSIEYAIPGAVGSARRDDSGE